MNSGVDWNSNGGCSVDYNPQENYTSGSTITGFAPCLCLRRLDVVAFLSTGGLLLDPLGHPAALVRLSPAVPDTS